MKPNRQLRKEVLLPFIIIFVLTLKNDEPFPLDRDQKVVVYECFVNNHECFVVQNIVVDQKILTLVFLKFLPLEIPQESLFRLILY